MHYENIWNIEKQGGDSDIDLVNLSNGKQILFKKYYTEVILNLIDNSNKENNPIFTLEDIKKYHKIQNGAKLIQNKLILNEPITLLGNRINTFVVNILNLDEENILHASDLETKIEIIITNPQYIEGIKGDDTLNLYLRNIEAIRAKEIKKIIQDNIISDKMYYPINSGGFKLSQISTFNIKVISIENGVMKLLITDIANKIKELIKK